MLFLYLPLSANVAPPVTFPPPAPDVPIFFEKPDNKYKPSVKLNYRDLFLLIIYSIQNITHQTSRNNVLISHFIWNGINCCLLRMYAYFFWINEMIFLLGHCFDAQFILNYICAKYVNNEKWHSFESWIAFSKTGMNLELD